LLHLLRLRRSLINQCLGVINPRLRVVNPRLRLINSRLRVLNPLAVAGSTRVLILLIYVTFIMSYG
jgi:hypothetical protein